MRVTVGVRSEPRMSGGTRWVIPWATIPVAITLLLGAAGAVRPDLRVYVVRPEASLLYVVTHRSGLLSFLGHEHAIIPGEWRARLCLTHPIPAEAHGSLVVATASLVVDSDSARALAGLGGGPGEGDRREIQRKMLDSSHLDAGRFPEIAFDFVAGGETEGEQLAIHGTASLHGVTREVDMPIRVELLDGGAMRLSGVLRIRQRDFGIEPESIRGVIRVSDDVDLHFSLVAVPSEVPCSGLPGA